MIDRYTLSKDQKFLEKQFNALFETPFVPRYNVAPTQSMPVLTQSQNYVFQNFQWGLISNWANNKTLSPKLFNLKANEAMERPTYRKNMITHRCLIPADGFFVWKPLSKKKVIPYYIYAKDQSPFMIAGLWEEKDDFNEKSTNTFIIITSKSTRVVAPYQENMPFILDTETAKKWINTVAPVSELNDILQKGSKIALNAHPVSPLIAQLNQDSSNLIAISQPSDQYGNYTLFN